jgi:site-specific recombinase XerD
MAAGLETKGTLHTLRHTFASHLVQAGVDLYSVSKLLGHSSIKMTEIYAHLAPKTLQEVIKRLPKIE